MTTQYGLKAGVTYRARLRGMPDGGWKGNQDYVGEITFQGPDTAPTFFSTTIPFLVEHLDYKIDIKRTARFPRVEDEQKAFAVFDLVKAIVVPCEDEDAGSNSTEITRLVVEFHRDDIEKFSVSAGLCSNPPTQEEAAYDHAVVLDAPYTCTPEEQALLEVLEGSVFSLGSEALTRPLAFAMIRRAVHSPGEAVYFSPMPPWLPSTATLRAHILGYVTATGLAPFTCVYGNKFVIEKPVASAATAGSIYEYTRVVEPWLESPAFFSIAPTDKSIPKGVPLHLGSMK